MENTCAMSLGNSWCLGMALHTMWRVDASASYQVPKFAYTDPCLVAIRTLAGAGAVDTAEYGRIVLDEQTLYFCEMRQLRHYGTVGERWLFHWWEFSRESGMDLPWYEPLSVPPDPGDTAAMTTQIFALLNEPRQTSQVAASALFSALIHLWSTRWQRTYERPAPLRNYVTRAIGAMQADLSRPFVLADLARECNISPRWLRQAFISELGISPKRYHTQLRLDRAASALRMGVGNVTQVAQQVGYACPFHFSRAFKAHFGCCPSVYIGKL